MPKSLSSLERGLLWKCREEPRPTILLLRGQERSEDSAP